MDLEPGSSFPQNSVSFLQVSKNDDDGNDVSSFLDSLILVENSIKGHVLIARKGDTSKFLMFAITTISYTATSNSYFIGVSLVSESEPSPFGTTDPDNDIILSFAMVGTKGDKGDKGAQGEPGVGTKGAQGEDGPKGTQVNLE